MKKAYVTVLYGNTIYFLGAIVLGFSLKRVKSSIDTIILVTNDVPPDQIKILEYLYTKVIRIEYIHANEKLIKDYDKSRFKDVFTKLRCLELDMYDKIILLDLDMLVLQNMDELFDLPTPSACYRGKVGLTHGEIIPRKTAIKYGINAGLMILKPDRKELDQILKDMQKPKLWKFKYPEQEYLSFHYAGKWRNVDIKYNYQVGLEKRKENYYRDIK